MGQGPREKEFGAKTRADQKDSASSFLPGTCCQREGVLRLVLPTHEFIQLFAEKRWADTLRGRITAAPLLVDDRLAKLGALAADIHVSRPLNERSDLGMAFAAERASKRSVARFHGGSFIDPSVLFGPNYHSPEN
jgi:hypothetical protein